MRALAQLVGAGGDLRCCRLVVGDEFDPGHQVRLALQKLLYPEPLRSLADHVMRTVGSGEVAQQVRDGADPIEILRPRASRWSGRAVAPLRAAAPYGALPGAAAIELPRPTTMGKTIPGKSTRLRTGRRIIWSSASLFMIVVPILRQHHGGVLAAGSAVGVISPTCESRARGNRR